jgi:hypothetical protein
MSLKKLCKTGKRERERGATGQTAVLIGIVRKVMVQRKRPKRRSATAVKVEIGLMSKRALFNLALRNFEELSEAKEMRKANVRNLFKKTRQAVHIRSPAVRRDEIGVMSERAFCNLALRDFSERSGDKQIFALQTRPAGDHSFPTAMKRRFVELVLTDISDSEETLNRQIGHENFFNL